MLQDFSGGLVTWDPLANAGYMGLGRFQTTRATKPRAPQPLSLHSIARALQQEKPPQ